MIRSSRVQFVIVTAAVVLVGFVSGAVFGPPDAGTQGAIAAGVVAVGLAAAYVVVYRTNVFASGDSKVE